MSLTSRLTALPISNAAYGIAEYLTQPILMLCSAPFLMHYLGIEQYAIWILASAAVTGGTLLSAGFGDAAVKYISAARGHDDHASVERILRTLLSLNLLFSLIVATTLWSLTPFLAKHLPHLSDSLRSGYQQSLALGCLLLILKSIESVFVCTQRAYERYGTTTRIAIVSRTLTIVAAITVAALGYGVVTIMLATVIVATLTLAAQAIAVRRLLAPITLLPTWNPATARELFSFGAFSWLQGLVGILSSQADRILVGYLLGAQALAYYSICVQIAMPIHGIAGAGLQVIFPYLGSRLHITTLAAARKYFTTALAANSAIVLALTLPIALGSSFILRHWLGADFALHAALTLTVTACGFALLGMNVTGYYILLAFGRIRFISLVNIIAAVAMLAAIAILAPRFGILGAAIGRLIYGPITWVTYRALHRTLGGPAPASADSPTLWTACENS
jgi:O-antigen/teichoic acid export membrane protein